MSPFAMPAPEHEHRCFMCQNTFICATEHVNLNIAICDKCADDPRIMVGRRPNGKRCPLCGERPRAVTKSGHVRPYCRECVGEVNRIGELPDSPGEVAILRRVMKLIELSSDRATRARIAQYVADRYGDSEAE